MFIALLVLNTLLALVFLGSGTSKIVRSRSGIISGGMTWAADFSSTSVKLIGALEILGAIGVIVPMATGIVPGLSPFAALSLAVIMVGAVMIHIRRKESFAAALVLATMAMISTTLGFLLLT